MRFLTLKTCFSAQRKSVYLKVKIATSFRIFQLNLTNRLFFLTKKLLLFHVSVLKLLQMEKFIFFWDTLTPMAKIDKRFFTMIFCTFPETAKTVYFYWYTLQYATLKSNSNPEYSFFFILMCAQKYRYNACNINVTYYASISTAALLLLSTL